MRGQAAPRRRALILIGLLCAMACRAKRADTTRDGAPEPADAALPETVTVVLDAGRPRPRTVMLLSGLPRPCTDRVLGTMTFAQSDEKVVITSSKTRARATCDRIDETTLSCDWVGVDGQPTLSRATVSYGIGKKIGGRYDPTHAFACAPQR